MSKRLVISSNYLYPEDLGVIEQAAACRIDAFPKLSELTTTQIEAFEQCAKGADLVIIALFGTSATLLDRLPLKRITAPKALWSFDSHHDWALERQWQDRFDKLFIAHSPYLKFFDEKKTHWLPCGYVRFGQDQLLKLLAEPPAAAGTEISVIFPHKSCNLGTRQDLEPALRRACAKLEQSSYFGTVESGLPYLRAIQGARVVLNVSIKDDLNIRNFEAWALNRVLLVNRTPDHARIAFPEDSTFFFDRNLRDFEERLGQAMERSRHRVQTSGFVLNHHMLAHRIVEMFNVCLGQNCRLPEVRDPGAAGAPRDTPGCSEPPCSPSPKPAVRQTAQPLGGSRGNVGVMVLANRTVNAAPVLCATRLQIEDNIGEAIHIHWRDLRLDFSVRDFLALADACATALEHLGHKTLKLNLPAPGEVSLPSAFVRDLGSLKEKIFATKYDEVFLDDLKAITYFSEGGQRRWKSQPVSESVPFRLLQSETAGAAYSQYQKEFSTCGHSLEKFQQLVDSMLEHGYPAHGECIVLHGDEPFIRDGQHRAAVLRYFLGNVKVPVVRLQFEPGFAGWSMEPARPRRAHTAEQTVARLFQNGAASGGSPKPVLGFGIAHPDGSVSIPLEPRSILWVRTDSIGDAVLASSMLPHLATKYPAAKIAVVCQDRVADLYAACPIVDTIICFDYKKAVADEAYRESIIGEIAEFHPDLVLNSHYSGDALTELLTLSHRAPETIGLAGDLSNIAAAELEQLAPLYSRRIPSPGLAKPEMERHRDFLAGLGLKPPQLEPMVWTATEDEAVAEAFFKQHELDRSRTIALFPKAQYAIKDYAGYAEALRDLGPGFQFLIFGGPEVEASAQQLAAQLPGASINLAGKTTLREMAALIRRCRLYVGADSAGAHIACAVGTPNVVVLGGGHFGRFLPYSPLTSVVCLPLGCYGCNWRCRFGKPHCIQDLAPGLLAEAIRQTLAKKAQKPRVFVAGQATWSPSPGGPQWTGVEPWLRGCAVEVVCEISVPRPVVSPPAPSNTAQRPGVAPAIPVSAEMAPSRVPCPRVSVLVSTYKSERFIRGCLEDLEAQTIADQIEIIVVDSGSPENERAIVEEFQGRYPNIRYLRTEQRETVYGAWNRAIQMARGKYLTNANTDDRHRKDALETLAGALEQNSEFCLAYADCLITRTENETFETAHVVNRFAWLDFNPAELLFKGCFVGPQPLWRRDVHDEHGLFDAEFVSAGDYEFWLRLARNRKFLHVKQTLGLYLESPTSVEHSNQNRAATEVLEARRRHGPSLVPGFRQGDTDSQPQPQPQKPKPATKPSQPSSRGGPAPITLPPCALIGHLGQARALFGQKKLRAAWESTLVAIKSRPFHPEAYLLLAQLAQATGDATSSRRCAQHARSLAPEWKPATRFLKSNLRGNTRPAWLVLPEPLAPCPSPLAPRLSICLIVKDEEKFLGQCLASVRGIADQIVVVDTGSTDRTVAIAKEHGAEVYDFAWCDDFSAARNAALEHATGDWVLMLDADEELPPASHDALRKLLAAPGVMAWRLPIIDVGREAEGCCYVPRLFRNAPALFYVGRVHEQVFTSIEVRREEWGLDSRLGDAALRHHGYLPEVIKDRNKIQRNLLLLEKAIVELPDEPNLLMNYGLELVRSGQAETGLVQYRKAFDLMSSQAPSLLVPETREMLLTQFCTQLTAQRRFDEIIRVLTAPLAQSGGMTASLHFALGLAHLELKQSREAADQMRQCLAQRGKPSLAPINPEIHKAGPRHCLGLCLAQFGELDAAAEEFCLAIKDDPQSRPARFDYARFLASQKQPVDALNVLFELANQNSVEPKVWLLGGQIALSQPEFLEVALDWTAEARRNLPQNLALLRHRAEALTLAAKWEEALPLWRQLPNESDPSVAAALGLCETLANEAQFAPPAHLESEISREFVKWYQRLIQFGARSVIERVNTRLGALACALPSAASVLSAALAEALDTAPA